MYQKIFRLKNYLKDEGFEKEFLYLKKILAAAYSTIPMGDTTLPDDGRSSRIVSLSEEVLRRHNIQPIKYIAGTEAMRRGEGTRTAEGNIYEVVYNGERAIAKIVPIHNQEPNIWSEIMRLDIPEEQKKYLPKALFMNCFGFCVEIQI